MMKHWFLATALLLVGCGFSSGEETEQVGLGADTALPPRKGTIVIDGCVIDTWSRSTLALSSTKKTAQQVIMLCAVPRFDGTVGPRDPSASTHLKSLVDELHREGYRVNLGIAFTDESGQRYDGAQTRELLASPAWRARFVETLPAVLDPFDGAEIDLQFLPNDARPHVTSLVAETAAKVRPQKELNAFIPPSVSVPSDLPGGEAFSRLELAPHLDRMRIMTLDFSETRPGPTLDPGWAVDAVRLALRDFPRCDVSVPLYGTDFGPRGRRPTTWFEAQAITTKGGIRIERGPTGAPFFKYVLFGNETHELWYDDATSTARALGSWTLEVLPAEVGVLFYGLGAEDPTLFESIGGRMP
jgi:spore germination protein YaaH